MSEEMYVDGQLYLVRDGSRLLEPINGSLMEIDNRPDADVCFGRQLNWVRDQGASVEMRER